MPYPLRSTVGVAVLAGALVFSGTAANAQPVEADDLVASAPVEQGTSGAGESASVIDQGEAQVPPVATVDGTAGDSTAAETETPEADAPSGDAAKGPADTTEQQPSGSGEDAGDEQAPGADAPEDAPAETTDETPAEEDQTLTEEAAPLTGAEAPAAPSSTEGISRPAADVVPATGTTTDAAAKVAAKTEKKAGADAEAASLPGSGKIEFPEGADDWTDEQWNEWMGSDESGAWFDANEDALVELIDSEEFAEFGDSIFGYIVEGDPEGLLAYLEATYPNDPLLAKFMVGLVMGQLMEDGLLDEDGNFIGELVLEEEEPAGKPDKEPSKETVIEPVANITKPKVSTTKPVEVFTPVKVPAQGLAETGAEGIGLLAGAGGGLLVLGVGALALRRRKQA